MASKESLPDSESIWFFEEQYRNSLTDGSSMEPALRALFDATPTIQVVPGQVQARSSMYQPLQLHTSQEPAHGALSQQEEVGIGSLLAAYRQQGHHQAHLNPLAGPPEPAVDLQLASHGLTAKDLPRRFLSSLRGGTTLSLQEILQILQRAYCGGIGLQTAHIDHPEIRAWLADLMEQDGFWQPLTASEQHHLLRLLCEAESFENFVHTKFLGAKRFSLEGCETFIPMLDAAIERAAHHGVEQVVIGMPHRGRLNVLVNIMGKSPSKIFREFADADVPSGSYSGDVKYHLGYSFERTCQNGRKVHLSLCFNPSHLGFVGPVALGRSRAKQDRLGEQGMEKVLPLLIHGDAAFAGQGVVQETFTMSQLPGYRCGGTLHLVVNNQVGFTTSPESARSSRYATDVAKMLDVPIFHVNADMPEEGVRVMRAAVDFRRRFQRDVVIDLIGYRRFGHNEGDEPTYTQPVMYRAIGQHPTVYQRYRQNLLEQQRMTAEQADEQTKQIRQHLDKCLERAREKEPVQEPVYPSLVREAWQKFQGSHQQEAFLQAMHVSTAVSKPLLKQWLLQQCVVPKDFSVHPKLARLLEQRKEMAEGNKLLDWGAGESLAYASLVAQGHRVRISGQDSGRGTFSHRHAVLHDYATAKRLIPLQHLTDHQAPFDVWDSPLSETGVLGFDYGYSLDYPEALTVWEAQFGDFCNGAQVIIDQFIASSEHKWHRFSGIVLLLPHGFEGQGPEHSSARLERFLGLAAQNNMYVTMPSTPAQIFHLLRRQMLQSVRKPLIVMTPKSLLRSADAQSTLDDLAQGSFRTILPDESLSVRQVRKIILCSGKMYYDLQQARATAGLQDVALLRMEQLYPLDWPILQQMLAIYPANCPICWVQEEPQNMGAWPYVALHLGALLGGERSLQVVAREEASSPATGSMTRHKKEQAWLLEQALA